LAGYAEDAYGRSTEVHQDWPEEYNNIDKAKIACVEGLGVRNYIFLLTLAPTVSFIRNIYKHKFRY